MRIKYINVIFILLLIFQNYLASASQPTLRYGQLWVDGTKLKGKNGEDVVLRGMSFGWHNWWFRFYNSSTVKWLSQDWKCSVLRIPLGIEPDSGYIQNPEWSKIIISSVIDAAIDENIYVIIDWHSHNIQLERAKEFFTEMAQKYGSYPNIIYEIFNEPDNESWDEIKAYSTEIISTIRKIDHDNIILVGTPFWSQNVDVVANEPILGYDNIMYTLHFYAASHKVGLRKKVKYAIEKELPILVTECSASDSDGRGEINKIQFIVWLKLLEKEKISWIMWSISDKEETTSTLASGANSNGYWNKKELTDSGKIARFLLRCFSFRKKLLILVYISLVIAGYVIISKKVR